MAGAKGKLGDEAAPLKPHWMHARRLALWHLRFPCRCFWRCSLASPWQRDRSLSIRMGCSRRGTGAATSMPALKTLASHFGRLSKVESSMIVSMFRRQILSDGLYAVKRRFCRDPAQDLARQTLILQDGQFIGS